MTSKEKHIAHLATSPEEKIAREEVIDRQIFIEKLEKRIAISRRGEGLLSEEEIYEEMERWFK